MARVDARYSEIFAWSDWGGEEPARQAALARFEDLRAARQEPVTYDRWSPPAPSTATDLRMAGVIASTTLTLTSSVDGTRPQELRTAYVLYDDLAQSFDVRGIGVSRIGVVRLLPDQR